MHIIGESSRISLNRLFGSFGTSPDLRAGMAGERIAQTPLTNALDTFLRAKLLDQLSLLAWPAESRRIPALGERSENRHLISFIEPNAFIHRSRTRKRGIPAVPGVYLGASAASLNTFDIGSVEVLRGPQGLLFGQNVTAGAILVNTSDPTDYLHMNARIGVETAPSVAESFVLTRCSPDSVVILDFHNMTIDVSPERDPGLPVASSARRLRTTTS